jgi:hypothetical protein
LGFAFLVLTFSILHVLFVFKYNRGDQAMAKGWKVDSSTSYDGFVTLALGITRLGTVSQSTSIASVSICPAGCAFGLKCCTQQATIDLLHGPQKQKMCFLVHCL